MEKFNELNLPEALNHTLEHMGIVTPTPIQAQTIPLALEEKDILGSAQTGSGKTAAFGIPLIVKLMTNSHSTGLIMTPTRELAAQVMKQLQMMCGKKAKIRGALLIGGESMPKQFQQLRSNPRLFVGTPGRINDHLERGSLKLKDVDYLVLDETDRMLDMGFTIQIDKIINVLPKKRQTLLFSATLPRNIVKAAEKYMNKPTLIEIESEYQSKIKHDIIKTTEEDKFTLLIKELDERKGSIIVFVKTKFGTEKLAKKVSNLGYNSDAIHGDLRQNVRNKVISNYRDQKFQILFATDVASRGLDIPHIEHVINYDFPQSAEDYIHRVGRTGRAGATGEALCLVTPDQHHKWNVINNMLKLDNPLEAKFKPKKKKRGKFGGGGGQNNGFRASRTNSDSNGARKPRKKWAS